jgi:hypothetical protein
MARFRVRDTFDIPGRGIFVAGSIVEGDVRSGMLLKIPLNSTVTVVMPVRSVEFMCRDGREDVCLCVDTDNEIGILRALGIEGEMLEVAIEEGGERNAI